GAGHGGGGGGVLPGEELRAGRLGRVDLGLLRRGDGDVVVGDAALQDAVDVQLLSDDDDVVPGDDVAVRPGRQGVGDGGGGAADARAVDRGGVGPHGSAVVLGQGLHRGPRRRPAARVAADVEERVGRRQDEVLARLDVQGAGVDVAADDHAALAGDRHHALD